MGVNSDSVQSTSTVTRMLSHPAARYLIFKEQRTPSTCECCEEHPAKTENGQILDRRDYAYPGSDHFFYSKYIKHPVYDVCQVVPETNHRDSG